MKKNKNKMNIYLDSDEFENLFIDGYQVWLAYHDKGITPMKKVDDSEGKLMWGNILALFIKNVGVEESKWFFKQIVKDINEKNTSKTTN